MLFDLLIAVLVLGLAWWLLPTILAVVITVFVILWLVFAVRGGSGARV